MSDLFIMFPRVFAQSLTRSSKTALRAFNIAQFRVQRWSIPDSGTAFSTSYRSFGCSRPNSAALDRMSLDCNSMPNIPLPENCSVPQLLIPSTYVPMTSSWRPFRSVCFCSHGPSERSLRRPTTSTGHHASRGTQPIAGGHSLTFLDQK